MADKITLDYDFGAAKVDGPRLQIVLQALIDFTNDINTKVEAWDDLEVTDTFVNTGKLITDTDGNVVQALQPNILVSMDGSQTITASVDDVEFDDEIYDQNNDFNSGTFTFTAPVDGKYQIAAQVIIQRVSGTFSDIQGIRVVSSNRTYNVYYHDDNVSADANGHRQIIASTIMDMDANDTVVIKAAPEGDGAGGSMNIDNRTIWVVGVPENTNAAPFATLSISLLN